MTRNQEQKREDMTLESLEARLHHLPEVEVPEALEAKLLTAIPDRGPEASIENGVRRHLGAWDFGVTAAAVVLILALMLTVNYGLSEPSQTLSTQLKDTSLCHTGWERQYLLGDQNTLIEDTNYANCRW
jgi:hypothetical protein